MEASFDQERVIIKALCRKCMEDSIGQERVNIKILLNGFQTGWVIP